MKKVAISLAFLANAIALLMLSACSHTVGKFTPAVASDPQNTVFYIYRPEPTQSSLMKPLKFDYPDVLIDGKSIGALKYNEYLVTELTPGAHELTITGLTDVSSGWSERDIKRTIPANRSKLEYMKLQVEYDTNKMTLDTLGPKYKIFLMPVDGEDAKYEIRNTTPASK
jgi:hypothetical protein